MKRFSAEQTLLAILVGAALGGFSRSLAASGALLLLVPCLISLFWRIKRLPAWLARLIRYSGWAFVAGAVVLALFFKSYPIISAEAARLPSLVLGYGLAMLSVLFLLGTPVWTPPRTLFPATLGVLVVAAFRPEVNLLWPIGLAGAATFAYLFITGRRAGWRAPSSGRRLRPSFRSVLAAAGMFAIAGATAQVLPWIQVRITQEAVRLYGTPPPYYSSFSRDSRLGDLERLMLSSKIVMRVWASRPQKLRGRIFTDFDGQAWHSREVATQELRPVNAASTLEPGLRDWLAGIPGSLFEVQGSGAPESPAGEIVRSKIVQNTFNNGMLVSPGEAIWAQVPAADLRRNGFGILSPSPGALLELYGVVNRRDGDLAQRGTAPAAELERCLALPDDTDPRLKQLAVHLAAEALSPEERLNKTVSYVQQACQYSLDVGKFRSRQPVAEFLFEKKRGYCQYFASAAAVLLRLEGVPCRCVTGFNVQFGNREGSHFVVRESDAHAWIEAYLPGKGWVEADPTPETEYAALHAGLSRGMLAAAREWLAAEYAELSACFTAPDWRATLTWLWRGIRALLHFLLATPMGLGLLVLALFGVGFSKLRKREKVRTKGRAARVPDDADGAASLELADLMKRLDAVWAKRGLARPASRAPLEHLTALPAGKLPSELAEASRLIVSSFYQNRFGGISVVPTELEALKQRFESALR